MSIVDVNYAYVAGAIAIVLLAIWMFLLELRLKKLFRGKKAKDLEEIMTALDKELKRLDASREEIEKYLDAAKKLAELEDIKYVASSTGDHMFMLEILAKNDDELRAISEKLKSVDGVTRICPAIIKDTLKGSL